jgi:hypothetical protein
MEHTQFMFRIFCCLFLSRVTGNTCQDEIKERLSLGNIYIIKMDTLFFLEGKRMTIDKVT